jgi:hypothetical protein
VRAFFNRPGLAERKKEAAEAALLVACRRGRRDVVQVLLANGVEAQPRTEGSYTPLTAAFAGGHHDIVMALLERGARIGLSQDQYDSDDELMCAARAGHREIVQALLERGSRVNRSSGSDVVDSHSWRGAHTVALNYELKAESQFRELSNRKRYLGLLPLNWLSGSCGIALMVIGPRIF